MRDDKWQVLILSDSNAWAFAARANALHKYCPADMDIHIVSSADTPAWQIVWPDYDVCFALSTEVAPAIHRHLELCKENGVKLIVSHNSGYPRRCEMLLTTYAIADYVIINNYGAYQMIKEMRVRHPNFCNISNGVDLDIFYPMTPISQRPPRVVWTGSKGKWEDTSDVKGARRVLIPLKECYEHIGFGYLYHQADPMTKTNVMNQHQLRWLFNQASHVICASLSEGTPNFVLEAAACGCVPISSDIGNLPEAFKRDGKAWILPSASDKTTEGFPIAMPSDFAVALMENSHRQEEMAAVVLERIKLWDWKTRAPYFYALFRAVAAGMCPEPFTYCKTLPEDIWQGDIESPLMAG